METILAQTVKDWELIICDSYSDDGSWEFFQKFKGDPRIHMYRVPREGIYAGWNECLRRATGDYIYIATSDDGMAPNAFARLLEPLQFLPKLDIAVCNFNVVDAENHQVELKTRSVFERFLGKWTELPSIRDGKTEFLLMACFATTWCIMNAVVFRRKLLNKTGLFPLNHGSAGDIEWSMRAALQSDVAYVPSKLAIWRRHEKQATSVVSTRTMGRRLLKCLEVVLNDQEAGIPDAWKTIPGWQEKISQMLRMEYYDSCGLFKSVLKKKPWEFAKNIYYSGRNEPSLLFAQAMRGFTWSDKFSPDYESDPLKLIKTFGAAWPPREVLGGNWENVTQIDV